MYININANTYNHYLIGYISGIQRWFTLKGEKSYDHLDRCRKLI